jgi:hypothetical protein
MFVLGFSLRGSSLAPRSRRSVMPTRTVALASIAWRLRPPTDLESTGLIGRRGPAYASAELRRYRSGISRKEPRANVEAVTVSNSIPKADENAKIASPEAEQVPKLGSATREPRQLETQRSLFATGAAPVNSTKIENVVSKAGLTGDEARRRLTKSGSNAMPDTSVHPMRMALEKFWAPVPWMLEAAIVVELALGQRIAINPNCNTSVVEIELASERQAFISGRSPI